MKLFELMKLPEGCS